MNQFLNKTTQRNTTTENGAISNSSTGNLFVDDFSKSGTYRARAFDAVLATSSQLFAINPLTFVMLTFYLRMITRKVKGFFTSEKVQKGAGAKDESLKRLLWLAYYHPDIFYKNLWLMPLVGSWKDLWSLMVLDYEVQENRSKVYMLNQQAFFELMIRGLNDASMRDLVLKYMPQIKAESKCKTKRADYLNTLAKKFAAYMDMSYKDYRKFKANGLAHVWQQQISKNYYDQISFSNIPGKALSTLVHGKFLKNHNLTSKYSEWLEKQPVVKFNGYPHELLMKISNDPIKNKTLDKQFDMLIQTATQDNGGIKGNVWVAVDTSGSMSFPESRIEGNVYALHIAKALTVYFSALNEGSFKNHYIAFDSHSRVGQLNGTFTEKVRQLPYSAMGSTNFMSVIIEIARIRRQNPQIPIADYPETLLVVNNLATFCRNAA